MKKTKDYPLPKESLVKFADSVFIPLKNRLCVTCMFAAGGGKRTIIKFLLTEKSILQKIFGNRFKKTVFVYVDPDEILKIANRAYLQLILDKLIKQMESKKITPITLRSDNPLIKIKDSLAKLTNAGFDVMFLFNDFEITLALSPSIFLNLETIMAVNKSKIAYLFLSIINLLNKGVLVKLHNLKYAVSQRVVYFPLFNNKEAIYVIDKICRGLKINLSSGVRDALITLCGGHPQLIKYSIYILAEAGPIFFTNEEKAKTYLLNHYQLNIVCADIWNFLNQEEKDVLSSVVSTKKITASQKDQAEHLLKLGLIKADDKKNYHVFGMLFSQFVRNKIPVQKLIYDLKTKKLTFGFKSCEDKFTLQEFKLLTFFLEHENKVISRDEVSQSLWGKNYPDKGSDWSIDKITSNIRKKLDSLGFSSQNLVTLKKRGFRFSNP